MCHSLCYIMIQWIVIIVKRNMKIIFFILKQLKHWYIAYLWCFLIQQLVICNFFHHDIVLFLLNSHFYYNSEYINNIENHL
jgi:hypothetical protein